MDQITLPMTIAELRVEGAPLLVHCHDGVTRSGTLVSGHEWGDDLCTAWVDGGVRGVPWGQVDLDLHHPNGERIARAFHGRAPTPSTEDLAYLRDGVLATVAMVSE